MVSNMSEFNVSLIRTKDTNEIWSIISDLCSSHKVLFDFCNLQQKRIEHLEETLGTCAGYPRAMQ